MFHIWFEDLDHKPLAQSLKSQLLTLFPFLECYVDQFSSAETEYFNCLYELAQLNFPGEIIIHLKRDQFTDRGLKGVAYVDTFGKKYAVGIVIMKASINTLENTFWHEFMHIMGVLSHQHIPLTPFSSDDITWYPDLDVVEYVGGQLTTFE